MTNKLTEICENRRTQVAAEKAQTSFAEMDRRAKDAAPPRGFTRALVNRIHTPYSSFRRRPESSAACPRGIRLSCAADAAQLDPGLRRDDGCGVGLICEIKKASPSAGLIRPDFNPATLAKAYEDGGAACLSVLTESTYFQGCNEYLVTARNACALPALRKDFMVDVWQVAQARAIGTDCILLIMAALDDTLAAEMHSAATNYGMDVLIEVHDAQEMDRALRLPSTLIGINNRNLKTLAIDLATTETLVKMVPQDRLVVSESGLKTADDLHRMQAAGVNAFLIGESLMRQEDVTAAVRGMLRP